MATHDSVVSALLDTDVLIVDCQATGASPAFGRVLELGWALVRAGEPVAPEAHWVTLPEGYVVSHQVQKLTGYEPAHALAAIPDSEAWQRLRATVKGASGVPTAIHYARFELPFLRDWSSRFEPAASFPFDTVCAHAIANRLYPDLPRQSLRALAGYLGHSLHLTRRSLGHVEATAFVWRRLCADLAARGIGTWEELRGWLDQRAPPRRRPAKPKYPIDRDHYRSLPDAPGVYRFLRSNGDVLYVGKAVSLKKRTASHFVGRAGTPQAPEMLTQVSDIEVTVVQSAVEAALLENETIKALRPPYNVQLTGSDQPVWYSTPEFDASAPAPDERHCLGPVSSPSSLRPLGALIALVAGSPATHQLRSRAVGVSDLWTPDEVVFAAGWAELVARHPTELSVIREGAHRRALRLARKLLLAGAVKPDQAADDDDGGEIGWDPARVARHLERAAAQAYQTYRRARWLRLLHDSDVVYREPGSERARLLPVRDGEINGASDVSLDRVPQSAVRPLHAQPVFTRWKYDRLRILTTELKRVSRDGGYVAVQWGPSRQLPQRLLAGALRVI